MATPENALGTLAADLRAEGSVISAKVTDSDESPALGELAAAGPRAGTDPGAYALVIESVREGYLLHYGEPRVVLGADSDLALLAGDYLYALGLERLAALGDLAAVRELSDLISLSAQLHADGPADPDAAGWLWLAATTAIATGESTAHNAAKEALRAERAEARVALESAAREAAAQAGIGEALDRAADAIDWPRPDDD